ncbi:MAG TPA: hypothetical protein VJZ75_10020 [Candidatus Bathyarchaeia archaeon]|nr:hypothetical protein [Candidatus Bathyarchaeia archaeon]
MVNKLQQDRIAVIVLIVLIVSVVVLHQQLSSVRIQWGDGVPQLITTYIHQTSTITNTIAQTSPSTTSFSSARSVFAKGLFVTGESILTGPSFPPSFAQLVAAHFTIVGTDDWENSNNLAQLSNWLATARSYGLKTFVFLGRNNYSVTMNDLPKALSMNPDFIINDEPITSRAWSSTQLQTFVTKVEQSSSHIGIIIDEGASALAIDYVLFGSDSRVFMAEDDYTNQSTINYNARLAAQYGKPAITWLIMSNWENTSSTFNCYSNFDSWVDYAKQQNANAFFYLIDPQGIWQTNWTTVAAY